MYRLLLNTLLLFSVNSVAAETYCTQKYANYANTQEKWQNDSTKLIARLLPEYSELVTYYRDIQLASIKRRLLAVEITMENYPRWVNTEAMLNRWIDLNPEQEEVLSKNSEAYKILSEELDSIKARSVKKKGDGFRDAFRSKVIPDKKFQALMSDFNAEVARLNATACSKTAKD